jgi:hypothetical protein
MKGKSTDGDALRARIMAILQTMPEAAVVEFLERLDAELKRLLEEGKLSLPGEPPPDDEKTDNDV